MLPIRNKGKIYGFEVGPEYYKACEAKLRTYNCLKRDLEVYKRVIRLNKVEEQAVNKIAVETIIKTIDEAYSQIPESYQEAVKYCFDNNCDTVRSLKFHIEYYFGLEYKEVETWKLKLIYHYAILEGYPVKTKGTERTLDIIDCDCEEVFT